jgi:hypothetical protein
LWLVSENLVHLVVLQKKSEDLYGLVLQVPGLMPNAPPVP